MTYLVAAIEHRARVLANTLARKLAEKCSGLSDYEASDYLAAEPCIGCGKPECGEKCANAAYYRAAEGLADAEAEQEVAEPRITADELDNLFRVQVPAAVHTLTQTPAAGQRGENPAGVTPPTPAGSPDPSPTTAKLARQPSVRDEGSPLDSAIPPAPRGERPDCECWPVENPWTYYGIVEPGGAMEFNPDCPEHGMSGPTPGEFAAVAVLNGLADHKFRADPGSDPDFDQAGCCTCSVALPMDEYDWREHVAGEVRRRIDAAITSEAPQ